jgi:hypothetical protein
MQPLVSSLSTSDCLKEGLSNLITKWCCVERVQFIVSFAEDFSFCLCSFLCRPQRMRLSYPFFKPHKSVDFKHKSFYASTVFNHVNKFPNLYEFSTFKTRANETPQLEPDLSNLHHTVYFGNFFPDQHRHFQSGFFP